MLFYKASNHADIDLSGNDSTFFSSSSSSTISHYDDNEEEDDDNDSNNMKTLDHANVDFELYIMKTPLQLRPRLALGGEILTQRATFLPVAAGDLGLGGVGETAKLRYFPVFLLFFNNHWKHLIMAQPLLKEVLR